MHSHTAVLVFIHSEFSNVSSNCLPEMRHNYIGCICLAFLHYVFSNVSSNCLPERMHNHIGCICLTFLHCVFSNVSIKNLYQSRQSHIGCICLTFLHCAFSNVSSKHQLEMMQSHIGCNCARHCELCAALCAHNCVKKLWSDHLALTRVGIELLGQLKILLSQLTKNQWWLRC